MTRLLLLLLFTVVVLLSMQGWAAAAAVCLLQGWVLLLRTSQLLAPSVARLWGGCPSCG
jgi:hypothetical protein